MKTQSESIRIEYRLPADMQDQLTGWQPNEFTRFPVDRAQQERNNRAEFEAKGRAGLITRRAR